MRTRLITLVSAILLVVSLAGCSNWNKYTPSGMDDQTIEAEVRKNLADDGITGLEIKVDGGTVTLKGNLSADDERKAIDGAQKVNGVRRVIDNIDRS